LVGCTGRPTWTYSNGDLSIYPYIVSPLATWARHIVAAARPPTACLIYSDEIWRDNATRREEAQRSQQQPLTQWVKP